MQGKFNYYLEGKKEELEKALDEIKELAKTDEEFEMLYNFNLGIKGNTLELGMTESGNITPIIFDFESMMGELSEMFPNLEINGNIDYLEGGSFNWTSRAGVDDYYFDEKLPEGTNFEFDFPMEEVFDEEGNLILDSVDFECTICGTENEVEIKPHLIMKTEYLDGNDYSYEEEVTCSLCGVSHSVGFSFEE